MKKKNRKDSIVIDLPTNLKPQKEIWEELGFIFVEDEEKYHAMLPDGWTAKNKMQNSRFSEISENVLNIYDENNNLRGKVLYGKAELKTRYNVFIENINHLTDIVYFGDRDNRLYTAVINNTDPSKRRLGIVLARQWAFEKYPDWNDVRAYWYTEKNKVKEKE